MDLATPQAQVGSSMKQAMSPGASLRSFSQELLGSSNRQTPTTVTFTSRSAGRTEASRGSSEAHSLLLAKESELSLLRQQLSQITADFKYNLKLLKDRDGELEKVEGELVALKETAAAKDATLADARRALSERESALRDRDTRLASLEARHRQMSELNDKRIAEERTSRDEALEKSRSESNQQLELLREEAAAVASEFEARLASRAAAEAELLASTQRLREENETLRSDVQRVESRAAEGDLTLRRTTAQLDGAMAALRALEAQYQSLAEETQKADTLRTERILSLEAELEAVRVAKAASSQEAQAAAENFRKQLQIATADAAEAKAARARAETAVRDAENTAERLRKEVTELASRCVVLDESVRRAQEEAATARGDLEREKGAKEGASKLLEAAVAGQDNARLEVLAAKDDAERWRRRFEKLEEKTEEITRVLEDEKTRVSMLEQHCEVLKQQLQRERSEAAHSLSEAQRQLKTAEEQHWTEMEALQAEMVAVQEQLQYAVDNQTSSSSASEDGNNTNENNQQANNELLPSHAAVDAALRQREEELLRKEAELKAVEEELRKKREERASLSGSVAGTSSLPASSPLDEQAGRQPGAGNAPTTHLHGNDSNHHHSPDHDNSKLVVDELGMENARLRQQLAAMKLSFLDGVSTQNSSAASSLIGAAGTTGGALRSGYHHQYPTGQYMNNTLRPSAATQRSWSLPPPMVQTSNSGSLAAFIGAQQLSSGGNLSYKSSVELQPNRPPMMYHHHQQHHGLVGTVDVSSYGDDDESDDNDFLRDDDSSASDSQAEGVGPTGDGAFGVRPAPPRQFGVSNESEDDSQAGAGHDDDALANARRQVLLAKEYLRSIAARTGDLEAAAAANGGIETHGDVFDAVVDAH